MSCPIQGGDGRARSPALRQAEVDARAVNSRPALRGGFRRRRPDQGYGRVVPTQVSGLTLRRLVLVPRTVLPSSAMITASASASPAMTWAFSQVPNAAATACASSRRSTQRLQHLRGTSDAHSLIAVTESALASTAATANAITPLPGAGSRAAAAARKPLPGSPAGSGNRAGHHRHRGRHRSRRAGQV